jgi:type 1 glutamine amidotransferase/Ca2+-binding EF-hand superfamily protein
MKSNKLATTLLATVSAMTLLAIASGVLNAQAPAPGAGGRGGGGRGGGVAPALFSAVDINKDGSVTRDEMKTTFDSWYTGWDSAKTGSLTQDQVQAGLNVVFPAPAPPDYVGAMMAALPTTPGAHPLRARKILVYGRAAGFVHSSIPLAAKTVEALGNKGDLWTTSFSYDPNDINTANLKQYDAIFLDSTTGCFLDDPDKVATAARRQAFLEFVRSGKGVASIHAATDSYHSNCANTPVAAPSADAATGRNASGGGGGRGGAATTLATQFLAQADKNGDQKLSRQEFASLADAWFDKLDTDKAGKISQADFAQRFNASVMPAAPAPAGRGAGGGRGGSGGGGGRAAGGGNQGPVLDWPEFNKLIGGYFKFHWSGLNAVVKIDDPKSPLTAMFHGQEFPITDETYTFMQDSFSRTNVHMLTSIDYAKMSDADKALEPAATKRTDGDYALSYIRREGQGRVFYEAHGHAENIYAMTPMLEHIRAGIQYALGDLKADDSPSVPARQ